MTRPFPHCLPMVSLLMVLLLLTGCAVKDPETAAYVEKSLNATLPIDGASTAWGEAMRPWFEGKKVDLNKVKRVQTTSVRTIQETRDKVKAIPVPDKPEAMMFSDTVKEYVDWEADRLIEIFDEVVEMAKKENPASSETIAKAQARIQGLNQDENDKKGEVKSKARRLGVTVK